MQIPLLTQIYRINYPAEKRGKLYAVTGVTRAAAAVCFGFVGGKLLGWDIANYTWLLWAFAASGFISGFWTYGLPVNRWDASRWQRSDIDTALQYEDKPTIVYVHGNFMERNNTLERVRILDSYLKKQATEDYRLLLFSWPSQRERKPLRDIYENDEVAEDHEEG